MRYLLQLPLDEADRYHKTVRIQDYAPALREMLTQLRVDYGYNHTDALLVLKDILARVWKGQM